MPDRSAKSNRRSEPAEARQPSRSPLHTAANEGEQTGWLTTMREWIDALIIAFVLAMFIRTFVVELFKIPSGSMSPTLLGDFVAEGVALNPRNEYRQYLFILDRDMETVQVYEKDTAGNYLPQGKTWRGNLTTSQQNLIRQKAHLEEHRILVSKFAFWFKKPERGDIVVFKVPFKKEPWFYERDGVVIGVEPYNRNRAVYVKRAVAFNGETAEIVNGRLRIDGEIVTEPDIFDVLRYSIPVSDEYSVRVPEGHLLAFGDNTDNSSDSRMWGSVPYGNLRGKAFFRYWPIRKARFLN